MDSPTSVGERAATPRVQVRCSGLDATESQLAAVHDKAEELLEANAEGVALAVVNVGRRGPGHHRCETQLFGGELEHVAGYAEHADPVEATNQSVLRALRALKANERHNPWTSSHPGGQHGQTRAR